VQRVLRVFEKVKRGLDEVLREVVQWVKQEDGMEGVLKDLQRDLDFVLELEEENRTLRSVSGLF